MGSATHLAKRYKLRRPMRSAVQHHSFTACGMSCPQEERKVDDPKRVDCKLCRRTRLFKAAIE